MAHSYRIITRAGASILALSFILSPLATLAASKPIEVSGWIPYWATQAGTNDARDHVDQFTEINPFGYSVRSDGTLADTANMNQSAWQSLIKSAHSSGVRVVPTVMWSDTNNIDAVLRDPQSRARHVQAIVDMVNQNGFDGVDIDYEGKLAQTRDSFSSFLQELQAGLSKGKTDKWLECTIEARMPLSARYSGTPPANIEYANDLPKVNQYCDRVRVMTYDQQTADVQLNQTHSKELYAPVADTAWVEKVLNYMSSDIDKNKMVMGIATYGAVYQAMSNTSGTGYSYTKLSSFNPQYALDTAKEYGLTPVRGASGEMTLSYVDKNNPSSLPSQDELSKRAPSGTSSGLLAAAGALAFAKSTGRQSPVTYLTWSDAGAVQQKIALAQKLGIAGVAIFKIDGGEDPAMWDSLPGSAPKVATPPASSVSTSGTTTTPPPTTTPATPSTPASSSTGSGSGTAASGTKITSDLSFGMSGSQVLVLQKKLVAQGYLKATPNGTFGPATLAAVRAYQKAKGISQTGTVGPLTRAKLNAS